MHSIISHGKQIDDTQSRVCRLRPSQWNAWSPGRLEDRQNLFCSFLIFLEPFAFLLIFLFNLAPHFAQRCTVLSLADPKDALEGLEDLLDAVGNEHGA